MWRKLPRTPSNRARRAKGGSSPRSRFAGLVGGLLLGLCLSATAQAEDLKPQAALVVSADGVWRFDWGNLPPLQVIITRSPEPGVGVVYQGDPPVSLQLTRGRYWIWSPDMKSVVRVST